jgi:hypothetical protein
VRGIQVYTNKGPSPLQRRDNYKHAKFGKGYIKIFSRTTWPEKLRFTRKLPDIMEIFFLIIVPRVRWGRSREHHFYMYLY